jgi:hypothetical protein
MRLLSLLSALAFASLAAGCSTAECTDGEAECDSADDTQIRHCENGAWTEWEACPSMESCMTMDDGVTHCMDMSM